MTNANWKDLDALIEAHATSPILENPCLTHPSVEENPPIVIYRCDQEGYDVYYAPALGEATYRFDQETITDVNHLTLDQVTYFEKSGYWKRM